MPRLWGIRTLAIANGSECARSQGYSPYSQMLTGNATVDINYFIGVLVSGLASVYTGNLLELAIPGFLTTSSNISLDMEVRSLPDQQAQRIFYFHLAYHKNILFGLIQSGGDLANFSFNSSASMFPLDSNPGGIYDIDKFYQIPTNIAGINLNPIIKRFGFIPTTSSLDIGSGTQTITSGDYIRTYSPTVPPIGSKNVPFNNFFTNPLSNENHATLTINNAKWLWQEILGTPAFYSCSYACSGTNLEPVISGATLLCLQSPYTLSTVPSNALLTWSSSNINELTLSPTNTATVTATRVNNFNGQVTITATVSGACGNVPITKNVYLGAGVSSVSFSNVQVYNISPTCYHLQGQTNEVPGATQYNYYIDNVLIGTNTGSTNTGFDGPAGKCNRTHTIRVDAILYCGGILSGTQNYNVSSTQCSLANCNITTLVSLPLSITVFPNPASTALTVQVIDSLSTNIESSMLDQSYQLFIMDRFSRKVFSAQSFDKTIHISTDELPSDIYYLNIIYKDLILRKQIILKK